MPRRYNCIQCSNHPNGFLSFAKLGNHMKNCHPKNTIRTTEVNRSKKIKLKHINISTVDDNKNDASNNSILEDTYNNASNNSIVEDEKNDDSSYHDNVIIEDNNHDVSKIIIQNPSKFIYL